MSQALLLNQLAQLGNPDGVVVLSNRAKSVLMAESARAWQGLVTSDDNRYVIGFWETADRGAIWQPFLQAPDVTTHYTGRTHLVRWENEQGALHKESRGHNYPPKAVFGKLGVAVQRMRSLNVNLYLGEVFDDSVAPLLPADASLVPAIWCYVQSDEYRREVRAINQHLKVVPGALTKIPFDLEHWQKVADEHYPNGLPEPHSDDPTQWLFRGDIPSSADVLQVAVARLLGYRWPDQSEEPLDAYADEDGIVTLAPLVNQDGIAVRLRTLVRAAYESEAPIRPKGAPEPKEPRFWNENVIPNLLAKSGSSGMSLEEWLRDRFFDAHTKLFQQRPFIWHIWDGRKDGFHAFVNYHKLDRKNLERLTHVYLGEWIERQRAASESGDRTADARLVAAQDLQRKLELIRTGEPPYDIFVRWKSLAEQPMGWDPDLNDGVRMNIRPFVEAGIFRGKVNVNWNKDRGKDLKPNVSGTVERHNDLHFTLAEKRAAREANQ
jgi:hypothetical protein